MRLLNGSDLASYIQERHLNQVRSLRQNYKIIPRLAIIVCNNIPVIATYVSKKQEYGQDIDAEVVVYKVKQAEATDLIKKLNKQKDVHGIIVQLPLCDPVQTNELLNLIDPAKDVDGLGAKSKWDPATPTAILWLLNGYNIDLAHKNIVIVGQGRLVGEPLKKLLEGSGLAPQIIDINTSNPEKIMSQAQILITATGKPGIIKASMVPQNCVVVDAGTANDSGKIKGDLADDVYQRQDLTITPKIGGVGPLTVAALFENVIRAANSYKE